VLAPRHQAVLEREVAPGQFEAVDGPVTHYRRTVEVEPLPDGRARVHQDVSFRLAAPLFGWMLAPLVRVDLGRLVPSRRPPVWAPPERLGRRAASALDALAAASFLVGYLGALLTQTFTFAAQEFHADTRAQGVTLAVVRADAVLALVLVALADRRGRRRLLLWSVAAGSFVTAAVVLIGIMAVEEMPAGSRAYAVSLLTMAGALGAGICVMALPLADTGERAWRLLWLLPLAGLPLLRLVARQLPESRRFSAQHRDVALAGHGRRLWLLAASTFLLALFTVPAGQFQNEFLRDERNFSAAQLSLFTILTATPASIGIVVGGRLADVRGRRIVGAVGVAGGVAFTVAMFLSRGPSLWAWSIAASVVGGATVPALGVYGPELFPTSLRGRANGLIFGLGRIGSVVGLLAAGLLGRRLGSLAPAFAILALGPAALAVLIVVAYPETAGRELEELNPEDAAPTGPAEPAGPASGS
jgi:MFS family permease